jgi:uncharacterized membrane protein YcaP (DUF421 family)
VNGRPATRVKGNWRCGGKVGRKTWSFHDVLYLLARAAIVALTRLNGFRSFSKMSGFDFGITVAMGSVLASAVMATKPESFWTNIGARGALFGVQGTISRMRNRHSRRRSTTRRSC